MYVRKAACTKLVIRRIILPNERENSIEILAILGVKKRLDEVGKFYGIVFLESIETVDPHCNCLGHVAHLVQKMDAYFIIDVPVNVRQIYFVQAEHRNEND